MRETLPGTVSLSFGLCQVEAFGNFLEDSVSFRVPSWREFQTLGELVEVATEFECYRLFQRSVQNLDRESRAQSFAEALLPFVRRDLAS